MLTYAHGDHAALANRVFGGDVHHAWTQQRDGCGIRSEPRHRRNNAAHVRNRDRFFADADAGLCRPWLRAAELATVAPTVSLGRRNLAGPAGLADRHCTAPR